MNRFKRFLLAGLILAGLVRARADSFDYSYLFADGLSITGTFDGTKNGDFVENVTNISLFINGVQAAGTIYTATFDEPTSAWINNPVISFDALQSNFLFANDDVANGGGSYDALFYLIGGTSYSDGVLGQDLLLSLGSFEAIEPGNWTLSRVAVPDSGATLGLLALALTSLGCLSNRLRQAGQATRACLNTHQ